MAFPHPDRAPQVSLRTPKTQASALRSGRNVWRLEHAKRVSFLIDADAYFRAFAETILAAREQVFMLGWDTDSRTELPFPDDILFADLAPDLAPYLAPDRPLKLGDFLAVLARARPKLKIYVLSWDFSFIYFFEREALTGLRFSAQGLENLRFVLDREHPIWASHHQKVVVVDDCVAFSGGLDLTQRRWDTPEHRGYDDRRVDPGGHSYGPFHDVQICVEGEAAKALGDLARERWRIATGEFIDRPRRGRHQRTWPKSARIDLRDVDVGIARTLPSGVDSDHFGRVTKPVIEVERLFLTTIRAAKSFVYIENQYSRASGEILSSSHPELRGQS